MVVQDDSHPALVAAIAQQIQASDRQRITFAEYMRLALYHPQYGYYTTSTPMGSQGDFVTSPHLSADFGELLAVQLADCWRALGQPQPFTLLEVGAGQGLLAADILRYSQQHEPEWSSSLQYRIIETSPRLRAVQRHWLEAWQAEPGKVVWCDWADLAPDSLVGCVFSNELIDAFPVHRVTVQDGQLREVYVTLAADPDRPTPFSDTIGELSTPALTAYFEQVGVNLTDYADGYTTEVNLAALDWLTQVSDRLQRGYVLTLDYGYPASRYYSRARSQGTLQGYYHQAHHNDPYQHVGRQDLTAHVDFTALATQGDRCGLVQLGATQQGLFLMALGVGDRLAQLATVTATDGPTVHQAIQRRQVLHDLINPMGLGNFGVLIQAKGLTATEQAYPLRGLTVPPLWPAPS